VSRRGGGRRPLPKKAHVAVSPRLRVIRGLPAAPRRPEGIRWLRSDGTPNWSQRVSEGRLEAAHLASRPPITVHPASTILEAAEAIASRKVRGLVLADAKGKLMGLLVASDIVNYLGGGEYYNIILNRYNKNIFNALRDEKVSSIANPSPLYVTVDTSLQEILELMVREEVGILPVLTSESIVYGVITEHDIVKALGSKYAGVEVREVASKNIVAVSVDATIREAAQLMVRHGFRRLPVVSPDNSIKGMITAKDIVSFFGSHKAFEIVTSGNIEEALETPVYELMTPGVLTVKETDDISTAASLMMEYGVSGLIVVDEAGKATGIVTERDVLLGLAMERG
jgi:CBS domain-containing protein